MIIRQKNNLRIYLFIIFFALIQIQSFAQENYIDYNPQYNTWSSTYQIDKIEFTTNYTIIHFRFTKENNQRTSPTFYLAGSEFAWVLETETGLVYQQKKLLNISRNGTIQIPELKQNSQSVSAQVKGKQEKTIFSCQIYFERLPQTLEKVALVEGKGYKSNRNHLNCLNISLKNLDKKNEKASQQRIQAFEKQALEPNALVLNNAIKKSNKTHSSTNKSKNQPINPKIEYFEDDSDAKEKEEQETLIRDEFEDYPNKIAIDHKPIYTPWKKVYILDKIVYTETEIIFSLIFKFPSHGQYSDATFYPSNGKHPWFLKDLHTGKKYKFKAVTNIKQDGVLKLQQLTDFPLRLKVTPNQLTTFSCRVHFDRFSDSATLVHLIEGKGKAKDYNHFNFFDIRLIAPNSKTD